MKFRLLSWLLFSSACLLRHADADTYPPFSYLGIEQGLSNNAVRTIFQDSKGFMWFGTYDGLNQYDGYTCKVFRNEFSDTFSLINNWINSISEDASGRLWVGTRKGLCIYYSAQGGFVPVSILTANEGAATRFTGVVNQLIRTSNGNLLIATQHEGLLMGNSRSSIVKQIGLVLNGKSITNYDVQAIKAITNDTFLMAVLNVGICLLDTKTNTIRQLNSDIRDVSCIEKVAGQFWLGSNRGIFLYDLPTNRISPASALNNKLSATKVIHILVDHARDVWIATNGEGISVFHPSSGLVDHLTAETKPALSSNAVYHVFEDKEHRKWIGTIRGGINIIDEQKNRFTTIRQDPYNVNSLVSNFILSYYEAPNGDLWIGTDGSGLSIWNRRENTFSNFKKNPVASSLSDNFILNIQQDSSGNKWLNTYYGGINKSINEKGVFSHYHLYNPADPAKELLTYSLCIDRNNTIWVGTLTLGGLYRYNKKEDRFDLFDNGLKDLFVLKEDKKGQLWGGNLTQLVRIDTRTKQQQFYTIGQPVRCIAEDNKANFWVGTEGGGLVLFDRAQNKIVKRYTIREGLSNNAVLTILPDSFGHLWMSTFNGISRFDIATGTFENYYQNDGLQSNQFNYNAGARLHTGEFVFGGIKGMNIFYPQQIKTGQTAPSLVLTNILVNNTNPFHDPDIGTCQTNNTVSCVTIPYSKAVLSFDFAALEYTAPEKISYAYFMEGWDKAWNNSGNIRKALYTHLDEGTYIFRVKCTNSEGVWNPNDIQLKIVVLPPWYRSWWAYLFYTMVVATIFYLYNRYRVGRSRLKYELTIANLNAEKEREKSEKERAEREREHAELEKERMEHEKDEADLEKERADREKERVINEREKVINDKKLQFFTDVAHEFRTPLTLVINPIRELMHRNGGDTTENGSELKMVYRNARRMINLVDQLLLFQKIESGSDELRPEQLDFCSLCNEVYMSFLQQAKSKQINYHFHCESKELQMWADRNKMEMILYNLFSNALKYTPPGGQVVCTLQEYAGHAELTITDTGRGIPEEIGQKIFERFYQVNTTAAARQLGFGIGLYVVKQFVEAHKGSIFYSSRPGKGTTFSLTFLKGKEHFDPAIIRQHPVEQITGLSEEVVNEEAVNGERVPAVVETGADVDKERLISEAKSILIIDDEVQMLQYVADIFRSGYTVHTAESGDEGLKLAQKYLPDIIISDIRMQGLNGIELCKIIKQDATTGHIPVVLLTGTSSNETRLESIEGGADDYITKPFEKEILVARVESLLKNRTALQHYFYNEITLQKNELKISQEYKVFIEKCIRIVEENLDDENFDVKMLTQKIGMSRSNLFRKVKSVSGLSIISFIRFIRLRKAAELFIQTNQNVNETAMQVGISDLKYFRKQFQKLFGLNPSDYIRKYRGNFQEKYSINRDKFDSGI